MPEQARNDLHTAWKAATLSLSDLWLRYFALGGKSSAIEVDAVLHGAQVPDVADRDQIALALNERLTELGSPTRVAYSTD